MTQFTEQFNEMMNSTGRDAPLNEITQVAAVAIACLEQYGCNGITINQSDLPGNNT